MSKTTKLQRSNRAHQRLERKHARKTESSRGRAYDVAFTRMNYHSSVIHKQTKLGRVLSPGEKKKAYDDVIKTFY